MTDHQQSRVLTGELHDALTAMRRYRMLASAMRRRHDAEIAEGIMCLLQAKIDAHCAEAGTSAPLWPRDEVTPTRHALGLPEEES